MLCVERSISNLDHFSFFDEIEQNAGFDELTDFVQNILYGITPEQRASIEKYIDADFDDQLLSQTGDYGLVIKLPDEDMQIRFVHTKEEFLKDIKVDLDIEAYEHCFEKYGSSHENTLDVLKTTMYDAVKADDNETVVEYGEIYRSAVNCEASREEWLLASCIYVNSLTRMFRDIESLEAGIPVLEMLRDYEGFDPEVKIDLYDNLVLNYIRLHENDKAVSLLEELHRIYLGNFGSEDERTLETEIRIADLSDGFFCSKELLDKKFKLCRLLVRKEGKHSPHTLLNIRKLCRELIRQADPSKAAHIAAEYYEVAANTYGVSDMKSLNMADILCDALGALNNYEDAVTIRKYVYSCYRRLYGKQNGDTLLVQMSLIHDYLSWGRAGMAYGKAEKCYELAVQTFGKSHILSLRAMDLLRRANIEMETYTIGTADYLDNALALSREKYELLCEFAEERDDRLLYAKLDILDDLTRLGRFEEALPQIALCMDECIKEYGITDDRTLKVLGTLARFHEARKDYLEASDIHEQLMQIYTLTIGRYAPKTLYEEESMLLLRLQQEESIENIKALIDAQQERLQVLGDEHPSTIYLSELIREHHLREKAGV